MKKYAEKLMSILVITAMLLSVLPGAVIAAKEPSAENLPLVTAANINDEAVYILNSNFRAHPKTSSIFEGDVPNNLLWTEFSNRIDHVADYDKNSKTYKLDDKYYQLVIERPPHGPGNDHQATKIIPDNGIVGNINDNLADGDENTKHRYHGWVVGTDQLFEQDTDVEHQVGGYTVRLMRLKPTEEEINQGGEALMNCAERYEVNAKALKILNITYTLSDEDIQSGYRLKCPMENIAKEEITELAMEGDWITVVDPNIDASLVSEEPKKTVSYWKIVKDGQPGENVGNTIPAADKDGTDDNCITLQAVLEEPKSYTYEFQRDDDTDTAAFPTAPPASQEAPNPTAPPASYNELISAGGGSEKIEYEPTNTIKPLVLRLVNTGNQRSYIAAYTQSELFTVERINVNTDEDAKKSYSDGGLDARQQTFWYIPSLKEVKEHPNWKNYALVKITPKAGLGVGTHVGTISAMNHSNGRVAQNYELKITVDKKTVQIAPHDTTKEYGTTLTPSDIICDVYDSAGSELERDMTAAELGITLESDGISGEAAVNGGTPYPFKALGGVSGGGDYNVTLKDGLSTGITVTKATPVINSAVTATGINDGRKLSSSKLSGIYVNRNSHQQVDGVLDWVDPNKTIKLGESGTVTEQYQFTPNDLDNYNVPKPGSVSIVVSAKRPTNLKITNAAKTYNGSAQTPSYTWDRGGSVQTAYLKAVYKKVDPGDTNFADDENYDDYTEAPPKDAGTYKVHATYPENDIFAEGVADGIMTIEPYVLGVNARNAIDKVYDGTNIATADSAKIIYRKALESDDVSIAQGALMGTFVSKDVTGEGYVTNASLNALTKEQYALAYPGTVIPDTYPLTGKDAANYKLSGDTVHSSGKITRRPLTLALKQDIQKEYGDTHTFTADDCKEAAEQQNPGGLASGDTLDMLNFELYADSNANESAAAVGEYDVRVRIPSGVVNNNYDIKTDNVLGKIKVVKATPVMISINSDNGVEGQTLESLTDEHFTGTFENPHTGDRINGVLEWVDPQETLSKEKSEYDWRFTPDDQQSYNILEGKIKITVGDKPIAKILEFEVPAELTYDGEAHPVTIKSDVEEALTTVEYRKLDVQLHDSNVRAEDIPWTNVPPVDAGTYEVRGTIHAYGLYAENSATKTMKILQAEPKGTVSASPVNRGDKLVASQLSYSFTGVKNESLDGMIAWQNVGISEPSAITLEKDGSYKWIFAPESTNYKSVEGEALVSVIANTRAPEAEVYNIPSSVSGGDYAYVNVDGENLKAGDTVTFYNDEDMTDPISSDFVINDDMSGKTKVILDNELKAEGGVIYVNIKYSDTVKPIEYKPQVGFAIEPSDINVKAGESTTAKLEPSDESYVIESADWTVEQTYIAEAEATDGGSSAAIKGITGGSTRVDVTASFKHPDSLVPENITVSGSAVINVEATPEPTETPTPATATPEPTETPTPATATPEPTETPTPATATPEPTETPTPATATPEPTETPTPATATPELTETPAPATATPEPTETPTPAHEEVYFITPPSLSGKTFSAEIANTSGKDAWFIAAAYKNGAMIDFKIVPVSDGTAPVTADFNADYTADSAVDVRFFLWDAETLKPYAEPVSGK